MDRGLARCRNRRNRRKSGKADPCKQNIAAAKELSGHVAPFQFAGSGCHKRPSGNMVEISAAPACHMASPAPVCPTSCTKGEAA